LIEFLDFYSSLLVAKPVLESVVSVAAYTFEEVNLIERSRLRKKIA